MLHIDHHTFHWLPNALTASRGVLSLVVLWCAFSANWQLGFWLVLLALSTDFLDGLAAKKLHAQSRLGKVLDPIVDCLLSACGLIGLAIGGLVPYWLILVMGLSAVAIGYVKFLRTDRPTLQHAVQSVSVIYLFIAWSVVALGYATMAYGWSWLYAAVAAALVVGAALLKRHRLRAWYGWLFRPTPAR